MKLKNLLQIWVPSSLMIALGVIKCVNVFYALKFKIVCASLISIAITFTHSGTVWIEGIGMGITLLGITYA